MPREPRLPERSLGRDPLVIQRRARTYGALTRDPEDPAEGWTWFRKDLSPPQLRTVIDGTTYKVDLTAV